MYFLDSSNIFLERSSVRGPGVIHSFMDSILSCVFINFLKVFKHLVCQISGFPDGAENAEYIRDVGLFPGSGRSAGGGYGNPLQYSCLENPMDRGV